jgi:predicted metal-binding protein|tara:strand:+ start:408 stop:815 length:408 start_codon:yes stop_codon:yes gene_type:complete
MASKEIVLSVCIKCKDNKESIFKTRGGKRLSEKVLSKIKRIDNINFREVSCMSQCKRGCVFSITAEDCFTYVFGDMDPSKENYVNELLNLISIYSLAEEGFMRRRDRPEIFRSNILGRLPPINTQSKIVNYIKLS